MLFCLGVVQPLGRPSVAGFLLEVLPNSPSNRSSSGRASGPCTGRPLTPQASTGSTIVFLDSIVSFGHMRLAFRRTACSQLYLMQTPASVSCFLTRCMYISASPWSFSPGGAEALVRSSEFLRFIRPIESGCRCSVALSRSLRFIARTIASRSSCVPEPTCEPAPAGPHCFGGGALVDVRRVCCTGLRFRAAAELLSAASLPRTLAARP